jgi:hypothetical protein
VYEVSGLSGTTEAAVIDRTSVSATTLNSGTTAATAVANEFWAGIAGGGETAGTLTLTGPASGGWTNVTEYNTTSSPYLAAVTGYRIVSATGTANYTATVAGGTPLAETAVVATFKGPAAVRRQGPQISHRSRARAMVG